MPEGPEVWILSKAINKYYGYEKTKAYGNDLFVFNDDSCEKWSFGLTGRVQILDDGKLIKLDTGWIYGDKIHCDDFQNLGIDWLTCSEAELRKEVDRWIKSKKKIADLMLNQHLISGIGLAWGSEILYESYLRPDMRCCDQVLNRLANAMLKIRGNIKKKYIEELDSSDCKEFINQWYINLYEIRDTTIYQRGSQLKVLGKYWWV